MPTVAFMGFNDAQNGDKSYGLTLPKSWIDIGKSERTAGVSCVAISRVKNLSSFVIEPMTYERITRLKNLPIYNIALKKRTGYRNWHKQPAVHTEKQTIGFD